ncbi:hypothetical protein [Dysosmobacter welbionis]|jgi:hypothetical protein|nr:hypothetical protein [Dysosmobacter welbionis]
MREILFKAKRLDNGEWASGSIVKARSGTAKSAPFKKYIEYREE